MILKTRLGIVGFQTGYVLSFLLRFWNGMYNRFEKGLQPRQSVTDYLMAVKEESQQLEEELESLEEVISLAIVYIFLCAFLEYYFKEDP